jgi:NOL1/NOP2/sun family putative RNA methylase
LKVSIFPQSNLSKELSSEFGYNECMISRFIEFIPRLKECLLAMEKSIPKYIRINTLKISKYDLIQRLIAKDILCEKTILDDVLLIKKSRYPIGAMPEYLLGYYYIQDLASCLAVEELDVLPEQFILDMASAPGGKTSFISQKMKNSGCIVALEPSSRRVKALNFNLSRCGVSNTCIYRLDGSYVERLGLKFDRILLDAPCSCEGIIAKDPLIKTNLVPSKIESCMLRQVELLQNAIKVIKPGGLIIYSTCTFAPEENELVINNLLEMNTRITIEPQKYGEPGLIKYGDLKLNKSLVNTRRFYPHLHNTSGFFIAKIRVL